jgi:hypothetical protein
MSLNAKTTKLASIMQNNHVYEYTAEGPTPKVSLNVRSPYRRQKRDSIIRLSFRRPHTVVGRTGTGTCYPAFGVLSASIDFRVLPAQLYIASVDSYPAIQAIFSLHERAFHLMARSILAYHNTRIEIPAINTTTSLPITSTTFLPSYVAIIPTTLPSSRSHRLLPTFLLSCDYTDYQTTHTHSANQDALDLPCPGMVNNQPIRSALDFHDLRHGKSPTNQNTRD